MQNRQRNDVPKKMMLARWNQRGHDERKEEYRKAPLSLSLTPFPLSFSPNPPQSPPQKISNPSKSTQRFLIPTFPPAPA